MFAAVSCARRLLSLACCAGDVGCADTWEICRLIESTCCCGLIELLVERGLLKLLLVLQVVRPELEKGRGQRRCPAHRVVARRSADSEDEHLVRRAVTVYAAMEAADALLQPKLLHGAPGHRLALRQGMLVWICSAGFSARVVREQDRGRGLVGGRVLRVQAVADEHPEQRGGAP